MENTKNNNSPRMVIGLIFIVIGILFLLDNYGILFFDLPYFRFHWEYILIALGAFFVATDRSKTAGTILLAIGVFSLFPSIWPLILVGLGAFILMKKDSQNNFFSKSKIDLDSADFIDDVSIFGGGHKSYTSTNFKGGKLTAIFGGGEMNFGACQLAEGNNVLDIFTVFGGYEIRVPSDWNIQNDVVSIFGGVSDERIHDANRVFEQDKILSLKGLALFGGIEIRTI
ncbi:MAG: cell wall-active antibiotics response protein [Ignavibacteriae bacterium]|nr:cell wall-active antibiotics response protein [Ignavibacteriota bacterium]